MVKSRYEFKAVVWLYPSETAAWHFVNLPKKESAKLKSDFKAVIRGWSSLPVQVTIGKTSWKTSIFYDRRSESYLLPLKAEVRKKEQIFQGDKINFSLEIKI